MLAAMQLLKQQEGERLIELRQKVQEGLEGSKRGRVVDGPIAMAHIEENLRKRHEVSGQ